MKRFGTALGLWLLGLGLQLGAAGTGPVLSWDFARGNVDRVRQQPLAALNADGQTAALPPVAADGKFTALKLDGKTALATAWTHNGSQTIRLQVKFATSPQGALISRHRPEEGMRGLEAGLTKDKFYLFDGPRPTAAVSAGGRDRIFPLLAPAPLRAGVWYDVILRFDAGRNLALDIVEPERGRGIWSGKEACPGLTALTAKAGDQRLCFGGRRSSSRKIDFILPAGTLLTGPTVWDRALSDAEVAALTGVKAPAPRPAGPVVYHVDAVSGSDDNNGLKPETPFATLARAAALLQPGDTLLVKPGVYCERLVLGRGGRPGRPILIKAIDPRPGKTVISAADPAIRQGKAPWQLEDRSLGLYSVPCDHFPARVLYSGTDLFPYPTPAMLKSFTLNDGYPGIEHGFSYDEKTKRLYVRLHREKYGSTDPNRHVMAVSPGNAAGSNGTQIWKPEESVIYLGAKPETHVIVDGFTLETPGAAGVIVCGSNAIVRNCTFKGCRFGVFGAGRENSKPAAVFVENCHYDQAYAFADMVDTIERWRKDDNMLRKYTFYWWQRKGIKNDTAKVKNYETGIAGGIGKNWHLRDNVIEEAFEGLSCWGNSNSENAQIYGNRFRRLIDNAVETENHARNIRICFNRIEDVFEPFSWQPLNGMPWPGPVFIYRNTVTCSDRLNQLWPTWKPGCFKLGVNGRNWQYPAMGNAPTSQLATRFSKRFVAVPGPGFMVFNNTIVYPYGYLLTTPMPVIGPAARELVNFRFFNNILNTAGFHSKPEWNGSLIEFYANIFIDTDPADPRRQLVGGANGLELKSLAAAGVAADFRLRSDSPAIGRGITTMGEIDADPDLGAVPVGSDWQLAAGPGNGIPEEELGAFQRAVRYRPEPLRTAGPRPGLWGVYSPDQELKVILPVPAGTTRTTLVFRLSRESGETELLRLGEFCILKLKEKDGQAELAWHFGRNVVTATLPRVSSSAWQRLEFAAAPGKPLDASWNGRPLAMRESPAIPATLKPEAKATVTIGRCPVAEVTFSR